VFDHTSILQFLEKFLSHKTGKQIEEPNISAWRRVVCGDLTSSFRPYLGETIDLPVFLSRNDYIEEVHKAKFKQDPSGYRPLTTNEVQQVNEKAALSPLMPKQEKGIRKSCPLPYELYAHGGLSTDKKHFQLTLAAGREGFGAKAAGSPFNVYAPGKFKSENSAAFEPLSNRSYAVAPGDGLGDGECTSGDRGGGRYSQGFEEAACRVALQLRSGDGGSRVRGLDTLAEKIISYSGALFRCRKPIGTSSDHSKGFPADSPLRKLLGRHMFTEARSMTAHPVGPPLWRRACLRQAFCGLCWGTGEKARWIG
jgi:hypothetical protein